MRVNRQGGERLPKGSAEGDPPLPEAWGCPHKRIG